jgi:dipeptidyl-peptidase-4
MLDFSVHPGGTFQLMQALIDANEDFDLLLLPRGIHAMPGYAMRRQWDYLVTHLAGQKPPENYELEGSYDFIKAQREALLSGREREEK